VAQGGPADAAADQRRPDVSNDGFDFGKLGQCWGPTREAL
jgi:hypothetical protein